MDVVSFGFVIGLFIALILPAPKSTVILLPDEDGNVGEISISNNTETQTVNTAFAAIEVSGTDSKLAMKLVDADDIQERYKATLAAQPKMVTNYILYFESGTSVLTRDSETKIPAILDDINSRKVFEAYIVGHTDTVGSNDANHRLGMERADIVKKIMQEQYSYKGEIKVTSHGEGSLLIPTADNIDEPKNRRVEIEIH